MNEEMEAKIKNLKERLDGLDDQQLLLILKALKKTDVTSRDVEEREGLKAVVAEMKRRGMI